MIDRSFAARGSGTVVTGTLAGGTLSVDDELLIIGDGQPAAGTKVRVRGLQTHAESRDVVGPGNRLAVNLTGVSHHQVVRGNALVRPGQWATSRRIDGSVTVLGSLDHDVSRRGAYQVYLGSGEHAIKLRVLGSEAVPPGGSGLVRLHLPVGLPLLPGDRFVLRESGRAETVGGGEVLDIAPVLPASKARPDRSIERVVSERGWVDADELERLTGERRPPNVGRWVVAPGAIEAVSERVRQAVAEAGPLGVEVATLTDRERAVLPLLDDIEVEAGRAKLPEAVDPLADHPFVAALEAGRFTPPPPDGVDRNELRELVPPGLVVERDGVHFAPAAIDEAGAVVARMLVDAPDGVTVAEVRDALGTSRKFILPLLNHLDATGRHQARGDLRIGGPRLPALE